jgi:hypothetical protein
MDGCSQIGYELANECIQFVHIDCGHFCGTHDEILFFGEILPGCGLPEPFGPAH